MLLLFGFDKDVGHIFAQQYLSVLTVLGNLQLIWWLHKVQRVSREPGDYVTELKAKHDQPALHIYSSRQDG